MGKSKAIRAFCLGCCLGQSVEVRLCPAITCVLHPFRMGVEELENRSEPNRMNRTRAVNTKCRQCNGEGNCDLLDCPLRAVVKRVVK